MSELFSDSWKECKTCGSLLDVEDYPSGGNGRKRSVCAECYNENMRGNTRLLNAGISPKLMSQKEWEKHVDIIEQKGLRHD